MFVDIVVIQEVSFRAAVFSPEGEVVIVRPNCAAEAFSDHTELFAAGDRFHVWCTWSDGLVSNFRFCFVIFCWCT